MIKLAHIFGSNSKAQEVILLLEGAKEVVRHGFYDNELVHVEKWCRENNVFLVRSRFKVLLADDDAFSNKGVRVGEEDKREGMFFVYLSLDEKKAWLASYYELVQNHKDLGLLLGYPSCCVDFFCSNFSVNKTNLELEKKNMWTNLSKREEDVVLLSHFPCNSECSKSIALAQKYFEVIKKKDNNRAQKIVDILS